MSVRHPRSTAYHLVAVFLLSFSSLHCTRCFAQCALSAPVVAPTVPASNVTLYTYTLTGDGCMHKDAVTAAPAAAGTPAVAGAPAVPGLQSIKLVVNPAFLPVTVPAGGSTINQTSIPGQGVLLSFPQPLAAATTFTIAAPSTFSTSSPVQSNYVLMLGDGTYTSGLISVPGYQPPDQITGLQPVASDTSIVDVLIGVGSHVSLKSFEDYTLQGNTVLEETGVGRAVPELLVGAGFTTGNYLLRQKCVVGQPCKGRYISHLIPDSIFINTQIPVGNISSSGSISGFTFGVGYKVQNFLEGMIGYTLSQYNEPSQGFRQAAISVIDANSGLPASQQVPLYQRYDITAIEKQRAGAMDGFPILQQTLSGVPGGQIFQGNPLVSHYRGGLFLGVAYPFSLNKLFQAR